MSQSCFSPSSIEKCVLHFLSLTLEKNTPDNKKLTVFCGSEKLVFRELNIVQERGSLPLLELFFDAGESVIKVELFGHISPVKFYRFEMYDNGRLISGHCFTDPGQLYHPDVYGQMIDLFPTDVDSRALLLSLYLWRSCTGLSGLCPDDLKKYFSKMKSVSRYEWINDYVFCQDDKIHEKWTVKNMDGMEKSSSLYVILNNGVITGVVQ